MDQHSSRKHDLEILWNIFRKQFMNCFLSKGQRQANLEARKLKEEREEQERQKLDQEEAKIQAEKRTQAIEKAKMQQYFQTEKIRKFHVFILHYYFYALVWFIFITNF